MSPEKESTVSDETSYVVIGPLAIAQNEQGQHVHLYRGAPVPPGQSEEWLHSNLVDNIIAEVGADADAAFLNDPGPLPDPPNGDGSGDEPPAPPAVEKPSSNASRDQWEAYALNAGKSAEDLDGLGRNQIRELFA